MVDPTLSKPVKKTKSVASHPKTMDMVVEAIKTLKDRKGISVQAIKSYILSHYATVSPTHLTSSLRRALKTGIESGVLVRPKDSNASGVSGRLRLGKLPENPKKKPAKKIMPKKATPKKKPVKKIHKKDGKKLKDEKMAKKATPKKSETKKIEKRTTPNKSKKSVTKKTVSKKTPKKGAKPMKTATKKPTKK